MQRGRLLAAAAAALLVVVLAVGCAPDGPALGPTESPVATVGPAPSVTSTPATTAAEALVAAIGDRLLASEEVAAFKRSAGLPIDDPTREAEVVTAAGDAAAAAGVDVARAETVVRAQIGASKAAQTAYLQLWASGASIPPADPSLDDARAVISAATTAIVAGLAAAPACPLDPGAGEAVAARLSATGLDPATSAAIVAEALDPLCP